MPNAMEIRGKYKWIDNRKVPFVPVGEWRWFGSVGHLIVGHDCRFHLCTQVGEYLVSTVGEYVPDSAIREILAQSRGIDLGETRGDARLAAWLEKHGFEEIGCDRLYETMVFRAGEPCSDPKCGCGLPKITGIELDFRGYNVAGDAAKGHYEKCLRWAAHEEGEKP